MTQEFRILGWDPHRQGAARIDGAPTAARAVELAQANPNALLIVERTDGCDPTVPSAGRVVALRSEGWRVRS